MNIGGFVGSAFAGVLATNLGRRGTLVFMACLLVAAHSLMGFAQHIGSLAAGRALLGVCMGLNVVLAPMYLSEISPPNLRGAIGKS